MKRPVLFICLIFAISNLSLAQNKTDVWDFSATPLPNAQFNNLLTEDNINDLYDPSIERGSSGHVLPPNWSVGDLSWNGGTNDRLRTTNTNLTRYDENLGFSGGLRGRIYVNSAGNRNRYLSFNLEADDLLSLFVSTDSGGELNFSYEDDPAFQTDIVEIDGDFMKVEFVSKLAGTYRVFDTQGKPSYYRITREHAEYATVTGTIDTTGAGSIPEDYSIQFTNAAGKIFEATNQENTYTIELPIGYSYEASLGNAYGYVISSSINLEVNNAEIDFPIQVKQVLLNQLSGQITGIDTLLDSLSLIFVPDPSANLIYEPLAIINPDSAIYTVSLEPGVEYTIVSEGVNDFFLPENTVVLDFMDLSEDLNYIPKPLRKVSLSADGLDETNFMDAQFTFYNINESGYTYSFSQHSDIALRDGAYRFDVTGLDNYPVQLALNSYLYVEGTDTEKIIYFRPVTKWEFDDQVITANDPSYKGLLFTGNIANEINKSHLAAQPGATIQIPVEPGARLTIFYYYTADFSIDGNEPVITNTQSTNQLEEIIYEYSGDSTGYVTLVIGPEAATTYITDIEYYIPAPFQEILTVGPDKEYPTINAALEVVRLMDRPANERVTIMIDPGNYEEMLEIDVDNITLKNASAVPDINVLNAGVDISSNAVRVTAYYAEGYDYFSMGNNQKWNGEVFRVNKENGFPSTRNQGDGVGGGSFWNATVVVYAEGFVAEHIIFENSFNQYISKKETEDLLVQWDEGSRGDLRPTDYGNTLVQDRAYVVRAAAIAFADGSDRAILNKCKVIGRQDSFFGGRCRMVMYKGAALGAVDYIFGPMVAVFYQTKLTMNNSDASGDATYITAARQESGRGYLMYECTVNATIPGVETASTYISKPGYFGRPWLGETSEVVFYNTAIDTSGFPGSVGKSLIVREGWNNSLGGPSPFMYEYGTFELSGEDNSNRRAGWSTVLDEPVLSDGTEINTFNFTKGNDGWDPLPELIANDTETSIRPEIPETEVRVHAYGQEVFISNVQSETQIMLYSVDGIMMKSLKIKGDSHFQFREGLWIIFVKAQDGQKVVKVTLN